MAFLDTGLSGLISAAVSNAASLVIIHARALLSGLMPSAEMVWLDNVIVLMYDVNTFALLVRLGFKDIISMVGFVDTARKIGFVDAPIGFVDTARNVGFIDAPIGFVETAGNVGFIDATIKSGALVGELLVLFMDCGLP
jgi:hypothetical protein